LPDIIFTSNIRVRYQSGAAPQALVGLTLGAEHGGLAAIAMPSPDRGINISQTEFERAGLAAAGRFKLWSFQRAVVSLTTQSTLNFELRLTHGCLACLGHGEGSSSAC
jgi:hypothetical protein